MQFACLPTIYKFRLRLVTSWTLLSLVRNSNEEFTIRTRNRQKNVIKSAKDFAHLSRLSTVEIYGLQVHEAFQPVSCRDKCSSRVSSN